MLKGMIATMLAFLTIASLSWAGGWDKDKGLDKITLSGQLLCVGCDLKKMSGANAQCDLFAHHAIGFKTADGTLWSLIDNAKGHDIIRAHDLLEKKNATITGWIYPLAHMIEVDSIKVEGISSAQIAEAGWQEDQLIAKALLARKVGESPQAEAH